MFVAIVLCVCVPFVLSQTVPCGVPLVTPITNRIVGGQVAIPGSWPWLLLIKDNYGYISGSGTILNSHVILTSAQHFEWSTYSLADLNLRYWRLYAGEYNINITDPLEKYYHIKQVIIHPGYNYSTFENDIALIITDEPIAFNNHTRPACLADATHMYTIGQTCYLAGWCSSTKTFPDDEEILNQVDLPILDDNVCQNEFPLYRTATELCAGYKNQGKDWCSGDVGGPLMCKDQGGAWYIQGIASSGGYCSIADQPSVFEDVHLYSNWVKHNMQAAGFPYQY